MNTFFHIIEIILFIPIAYSVIYIFIFAVVSLFPKKRHRRQAEQQHRFLVIFPAYGEDKVIVNSATSFIQQDYPKDLYQVVVVSDHMKDDTNEALRQLPITTLIANYHPSSKAKALQLAIQSIESYYDYVVILDADNCVPTNFLSQLNSYCVPGATAIQAHRQAKNTNTPVAILDAASEEINNTIFRKAHNTIGMASALIGSGMCFTREWFCQHVNNLSTAGEDKELEEALLLEGHHISYIDELPVWDEKVQSSQNFGNQRRRWIAAQLYSLTSLGKLIPKAFAQKRFNLIDKFIQQMIVPRSICLCLSILLTLAVSLWDWNYGQKWCISTTMLFIALIIAIPKNLYSRQLLQAIVEVPVLVWKMLANLFHLKGAATHFIHTQHGEDDKN